MPVAFPVIVKTKSKKSLPLYSDALPRGMVPPHWDTTVYCNLRTHKKKSLSQNTVSPASHFSGALYSFFPLQFLSFLPHCRFNSPVLQGGGYRISLAIPVGIMTWLGSVCTYRRDFMWNKVCLFVFLSQFYFRTILLAIILVNVMRVVAWVKHKHD